MIVRVRRDAFDPGNIVFYFVSPNCSGPALIPAWVTLQEQGFANGTRIYYGLSATRSNQTINSSANMNSADDWSNPMSHCSPDVGTGQYLQVTSNNASSVGLPPFSLQVR